MLKRGGQPDVSGLPLSIVELSPAELERVRALGKPFILLVSSYGNPIERGFDTLEEAVRSAWADYEFGDAHAYFVVDPDGIVILDEPRLWKAMKPLVDGGRDARPALPDATP